MSEMLKWLRENVAKHGAAEMRRQWLESSSRAGAVESPNALAYIESVENGWLVLEPDWQEIPITKYLTSKYNPAKDAGFVFSVISHYESRSTSSI